LLAAAAGRARLSRAFGTVSEQCGADREEPIAVGDVGDVGGKTGAVIVAVVWNVCFAPPRSWTVIATANVPGVE
jgi:hypothetical protein